MKTLLGCAFALLVLAATLTGPTRSFAADSGGSWMFIAYGDTRSHPEIHRQIITYILSLKPEFVIQSGDLVAVGTDKSQWDEFNGILQPLRDAHIAYYPARGNHDIGDYYIKEVTEPYLSGNGYYYSFVRHGIKFIALDNFQDFDKGSDENKWLVGQLEESQKKHQTVIPFFHESAFSVGLHGSNLDCQRILHPLFVKYGVKLVIAGHDHLYYRTKRDGVTYVVTGGGGAPLYTDEHKELGIPGDVYVSAHHIVRLDVTSAQIHLTALEPDGTVIDNFTVDR